MVITHSNFTLQKIYDHFITSTSHLISTSNFNKDILLIPCSLRAMILTFMYFNILFALFRAFELDVSYAMSDLIFCLHHAKWYVSFPKLTNQINFRKYVLYIFWIIRFVCIIIPSKIDNSSVCVLGNIIFCLDAFIKTHKGTHFKI